MVGERVVGEGQPLQAVLALLKRRREVLAASDGVAAQVEVSNESVGGAARQAECYKELESTCFCDAVIRKIYVLWQMMAAGCSAIDCRNGCGAIGPNARSRVSSFATSLVRIEARWPPPAVFFSGMACA